MTTNDTPTYHVLPLRLTTHKGKSGDSSLMHAYYALKQYRSYILDLAQKNIEYAALDDNHPENYYARCMDMASEIDELIDDVSTSMLDALDAR